MAAPGRLSGARGSIYLRDSSVKLIDSYMWEFEGMQDVAECTIKGETWKRYTPAMGHGRVRVQSFVSTPPHAAIASLLGGRGGSTTAPPWKDTMVSVINGVAVGTPIDFQLEFVDVSNASNQIVIGQGYVSRVQLHVARDGIITDEIEIEVDGPVTLN